MRRRPRCDVNAKVWEISQNSGAIIGTGIHAHVGLGCAEFIGVAQFFSKVFDNFAKQLVLLNRQIIVAVDAVPIFSACTFCSRLGRYGGLVQVLKVIFLKLTT